MLPNLPIIPPYFNGEFVEQVKPEKTHHILNPLMPNVSLGQLLWSKDWADRIALGLNTAQPEVFASTFEDRLKSCQLLFQKILQNEENIKIALMNELGRSRFDVTQEWKHCTDFMERFTEFCTEKCTPQSNSQGIWYYAPVGKVIVRPNVSLPFFTLLSTVSLSFVGGNVVCAVPSVACSLSTHEFAKVVSSLNFPKGSVQLVNADLEAFRRILLRQPFDTVYYAGGEESIEQIRRDLGSNRDARLCLVSGGKNAVFVGNNSNLESAVNAIIKGACLDAGQRIESTSLVFAVESVFEPLKSALLAKVKSLPIGVKSDLAHPTEQVMGPLCSENAFERFLRFQGIAARESEETLRWGKAIENPKDGYFVSPGLHVVSSTHLLKSIYATNPFFGPDIALIKVTGAAEMVNLTNAMKTSRIISIFGESKEDLRSISKNSETPCILENEPTTTFKVLMPCTGRHHSGNSVAAGFHFFFSTVFTKSLSFSLTFLLAVCLQFLWVNNSFADYRRAVEGNEVVKGKIYPRSGRFQANLGGGGILNQSFLRTNLGVANATYHFSEWHAISFEGAFGFSKDAPERECIENFYWNPQEAQNNGATDSCDVNNETDPNQDPNPQKDNLSPFRRKPAYMPIRQIDNLFGLSHQWTPVYGKALYFLSTVGYLDFYTIVGLGAAMSTYWPLKNTLTNGQNILDAKGTSDANEYGRAGRPPEEKQTSPTFSLGIGNRFYFAKHFIVNMELKNYTVFGSNGKGGSDWMNFVSLWGGLGAIF
jgi:outer membrane beta-barrel protein